MKKSKLNVPIFMIVVILTGGKENTQKEEKKILRHCLRCVRVGVLSDMIGENTGGGHIIILGVQ